MYIFIWIFFSHADLSWIIDVFWKKRGGGNTRLDIELDYGFRLFIHQRDFVVGRSIMENIRHGIEKSRRIIFIMSKWGQYSYCPFVNTQISHLNIFLFYQHFSKLSIPTFLQEFYSVQVGDGGVFSGRVWVPPVWREELQWCYDPDTQREAGDGGTEGRGEEVPQDSDLHRRHKSATSGAVQAEVMFGIVQGQFLLCTGKGLIEIRLVSCPCLEWSRTIVLLLCPWSFKFGNPFRRKQNARAMEFVSHRPLYQKHQNLCVPWSRVPVKPLHSLQVRDAVSSPSGTETRVVQRRTVPLLPVRGLRGRRGEWQSVKITVKQWGSIRTEERPILSEQPRWLPRWERRNGGSSTFGHDNLIKCSHDNRCATREGYRKHQRHTFLFRNLHLKCPVNLVTTRTALCHGINEAHTRRSSRPPDSSNRSWQVML